MCWEGQFNPQQACQNYAFGQNQGIWVLPSQGESSRGFVEWLTKVPGICKKCASLSDGWFNLWTEIAIASGHQF